MTYVYCMTYEFIFIFSNISLRKGFSNWLKEFLFSFSDIFSPFLQWKTYISKDKYIYVSSGNLRWTKKGENLDNSVNLHNAITLSLCNLSIICQFLMPPPPPPPKKKEKNIVQDILVIISFQLCNVFTTISRLLCFKCLHVMSFIFQSVVLGFFLQKERKHNKP